ncbi:septal ring lytic transglycosylase RlpA family protein [Rhizobiales bacterium TNE-4]|nr:septal ring lytic transglycosylase RlpA family protein [Rhizobiales bacterium TNE-4]MBV1827005.1 septal ring lytic transglycosylase RlpA family protein [Rhizobiales bacterium TNE-4]
MSGSRLILRLVKITAVTGAALAVANCSNPTKTAGGGVDPKYGVRPSPRVVADGQAVPKGGGRDHIGKPYVVAGKVYVPKDVSKGYSATGLASWYGTAFHGRKTANGEVFDRHSVSMAHPTLPLPSYVRVTNLRNGHSIIARVNDRGPYHSNRLVDVSQTVAEALNFKHLGTTRVQIDYVARAGLAGSDDRILLASLRTDGRPAQLDGRLGPIQVAREDDRTRLITRTETEEVVQTNATAAVVSSVSVSQTTISAPLASPALAPLVGRPASVPTPPERPFDLGDFMKPGIAKPLQTAAVEPSLLSPAPASVPVPLRREDVLGQFIQTQALQKR